MRAEGTAIVTGAGRGLGRAIVEELARRGFRVLAGVREPTDVEPFSEEAGRIEIVRLDVRFPDDLAVPLDTRVLVNNAGLRLQYLPVEEIPLEEAVDIFEVNLHGVLRMVKHVVPVMRRNGAGVVCNITSTAVLSPMPFHGVYRASKAAVSALSETLRLELAPLGVRVIEIPLGPVDTPMYATSMLARPIEARDSGPYGDLAARLQDVLLSSVGPPTAPAAVAAELADAILAEDGPLRWACDPVGHHIVDAQGTAALEATLAHVASVLGPGL